MSSNDHLKVGTVNVVPKTLKYIRSLLETGDA